MMDNNKWAQWMQQRLVNPSIFHRHEELQHFTLGIGIAFDIEQGFVRERSRADTYYREHTGNNATIDAWMPHQTIALYYGHLALLLFLYRFQAVG